MGLKGRQFNRQSLTRNAFVPREDDPEYRNRGYSDVDPVPAETSVWKGRQSHANATKTHASVSPIQPKTTLVVTRKTRAKKTYITVTRQHPTAGN